MTASQGPKPLIWIGRTRKDLKAFPEDVPDVFGYALHLAQMGSKHPAAKPLKGFGGAGVLEIVDDYQGNTYRAVYTVKSETSSTRCTPSRRSRQGVSQRLRRR